MQKKEKIERGTAIINLIAAFIGMVIGVAGKSLYISNQISGVNHLFVMGSNNSVEIYNIDDLIKAYTDKTEEVNVLINEKKEYEEELTILRKQYIELDSSSKEIISNLEKTISTQEDVKEFDFELEIDGEKQLINSKKSLLTFEGRKYYSEEILQKVLDEKDVKLENKTIYIGKRIVNKAKLSELWVVENKNFEMDVSGKNSYGESYSSGIVSSYGDYDGYVRFNTDKKYSYFKCKISADEISRINRKAIVKIKADDEVIYEAEIRNNSEPIEVIDITIGNCKTIMIEKFNGSDLKLVISEAFVYN